MQLTRMLITSGGAVTFSKMVYRMIMNTLTQWTYLIVTAFFSLFLFTFDVYACDTPADKFCVEYFSNSHLRGTPVPVAGESVIDHRWQADSPARNIPVDNFSGHWQGKFVFSTGHYIFHVLADDGVKLRIDGRIVIDGWKNQAATDYYATVPITAGKHTVEVEYYEAYGDARLQLDWEAARSCDLPVGEFCAAYFNNKDLQGNPLSISHEPTIAHNWAENGPAPGIPANAFSGRWQGQFDFVPGAYLFTARADDGMRLWVDDQLLIDAWINRGGNIYDKTRWLQGRHRVKVEYVELEGGAELALDWRLVAPAVTQMGTNLSEWMDWSTEQPFINVFKTSREWLTQAPGAWDTGEQGKLDLDQNGWVRSLPALNDASSTYRSVATLLLGGADLNGVRPAGKYVALYEGTGRIDYGLGATKNNAESKPGRDVITVDPNNTGGIQISIVETDPKRTGDYLRNLRVVAAGNVCDDDRLAFCETDTDPACQRAACRSLESVVDSRLFHPVFLRTLTHYRALRFMSPMSANVLAGNYPQIVNWSDRSTPDSARWANQKGIPIEVATALANQVQSDPWVNMPHQAADDYIRQSARLAHSTLAPTRKIYVEYANEIWNTAFSAGSWVERQGQAAWPAASDSAYTKRLNWYGKRSAEMCDIWRAEWPGEEDRVICVLSAQAANRATADTALDCKLWDKSPCQAHGIKAIAIAPYFGDYLGGSETEKELTGWAADADGGLHRLFAELELGGKLSTGPRGGALALVNQRIMQYSDLASRRGLALVAYEGGQHLAAVGNVANNPKVTDLFVAANRDPRMGDLYSKFLDNWHTAGGKLFINFTSMGQYGQYGSWGVLENMTQTSTPKLDALIRYIEKDAAR